MMDKLLIQLSAISIYMATLLLHVLTTIKFRPPPRGANLINNPCEIACRLIVTNVANELQNFFSKMIHFRFYYYFDPSVALLRSMWVVGGRFANNVP